MSTTIKEAEFIRDMSNEDYHADPRTGSSMLKLHAGEPDLFEQLYVTGEEPLKPPTDNQVFGTNFHTLVLEPERFWRQIAPTQPDWHLEETNVDTKGKRSTSKNTLYVKERKADWEQRYGNLIKLTIAERRALERMQQSVYSHKEAMAILFGSQGVAEGSIFWTDPETGLELKCRPDWLSLYCADVKTARDVRLGPFSKQAWNLGYHIQRIHYLEGIKAWTGEERPLLHIVIKNTPPYTCAVYNLSPFDEFARQAWRAMVNNLADSLERNDFTAPCSVGVWDLQPPRWAQYEDEYDAQ